MLDPIQITFVLCGALVAGFTTGFAGFGTGLVASGLWFHALPAHFVPPLVVLSSVGAHAVGLMSVRTPFAWRQAAPFLVGGVLCVPLGAATLAVVSPDALRLSIGCFLVLYAIIQLTGLARLRIGLWGGRPGDIAIGASGGFLGGFAGLSGPLPLIWLQLRGGPVHAQRSTYQPYNMVIMALAVVGMAVAGQIGWGVLAVAALCLPATILGAWIGSKAYSVASDAMFRRVVLALLLISGLVLVVQTIAG
ncbi:MAG: sulfite exporter TauE/SafE family protein [Hyphomicrobiaceae bacterium]